MRGRKPKPTALKLLLNNPGHRPLNPREPTYPTGSLECPKELNIEARAEWDRVSPLLVDRGQATAVDRAVLAGYCVKYAQWQALETEAAKHPFIVATATGYPIPNPALGMANRVFSLMLRAAAELGITPSSRTRVSMVDVVSANPLDRFTRARA